MACKNCGSNRSTVEYYEDGSHVTCLDCGQIRTWLSQMAFRYYNRFLSSADVEEVIQDVNFAFQRLVGAHKETANSESFSERVIFRKGDRFAAPVFGLFRSIYWIHYDVCPQYYHRIFSDDYAGNFLERLHRNYLLWVLKTILSSLPDPQRSSSSQILLNTLRGTVAIQS